MPTPTPPLAGTPLFICSFGSLALYLQGCEHWLVRKGAYQADGLTLQAQTTLVWLPLLELSYPLFHAQVLAGLPAHCPNALSVFPIRDLVRLAFTSGSAYWVERALSWAAYVPLDLELKAHLNALAADATLPQRVRHQAKRLRCTAGAE